MDPTLSTRCVLCPPKRPLTTGGSKSTLKACVPVVVNTFTTPQQTATERKATVCWNGETLWFVAANTTTYDTTASVGFPVA